MSTGQCLQDRKLQARTRQELAGMARLSLVEEVTQSAVTSKTCHGPGLCHPSWGPGHPWARQLHHWPSLGSFLPFLSSPLYKFPGLGRGRADSLVEFTCFWKSPNTAEFSSKMDDFSQRVLSAIDLPLSSPFLISIPN